MLSRTSVLVVSKLKKPMRVVFTMNDLDLGDSGFYQLRMVAGVRSSELINVTVNVHGKLTRFTSLLINLCN